MNGTAYLRILIRDAPGAGISGGFPDLVENAGGDLGLVLWQERPYAKHLSGSAPSEYYAESRSIFVAADETLKSRVATAGGRGLAADDPYGAVEEEVDLEPFVAFEPAFEMAIWVAGTEDASR